MPALTVKNIPDDLYDHLKVSAKAHHRSINSELTNGPYRQDGSPEILAEGVQALSLQAMALSFCTKHNSQVVRDRLLPYLHAWLNPCA
jgi:plasmid stability protein